MRTIGGWLYAMALVGAWLVPGAVAAADLPAGLSSPDLRDDTGTMEFGR